MASSSFECEVCNEDYNSSERKPLSLPCGHTFCRKCLARVITTDAKSCPRCRRLMDVHLDNLPVIYALINSCWKSDPETYHLPAADRCEDHGYNLNYFCAGCGEIVCRKCARQSHADHRVEFIDDIVGRDELSEKFVTDLHNKIQADVDHQTKSLALSVDISGFLNEVNNWGNGLDQYRELFQSMITSGTQDLETWQNRAPKSVEEKRKIFKKLCQYWTDEKKALPDDKTLGKLLRTLDEITAAAQNIQRVTGDLKSHLQYGDECGGYRDIKLPDEFEIQQNVLYSESPDLH